MRGAGAGNGTPYQSSFMRRVALPSPSTSRPFESSSRSIAAAACTSGLRVNAFAIAVPIRTREVACAIAPSGT